MIEVAGLRKLYGALVAVDDVSFTAEPGLIFGLLGPNGAGKSTTIGCLAGLLRPDEGSVRINGFDVVTQGPESRRRLGVVPQELAIYEDLTARENLDYWGGAYGLSGADLRGRVDRVLEQTGLAERAKEPVKRYSGGMKRRLNFACGLVHSPDVILLDEPTVGVDPQSRHLLLELVARLAREGACVLYTTHYMEEAEHLCDRLAIIDEGRIQAEGTLDELRRMIGERDLVRLTGDFERGAVEAALAEIPDLEVVTVEKGSLTLAATEASRKLSDIFRALAGAEATVRESTLTRPNLESLFIKLTGKELRE